MGTVGRLGGAEDAPHAAFNQNPSEVQLVFAMPPARKSVHPYPGAETAKRPFPRHLINIQDLARTDKNQGHLVINISKDSPDKISIKRSGDKLTVETRNRDSLRPGQGVEVVTRCYTVPEGGYTQELGAQLAADGLVSVRSPGTNKIGTRVIPINIPSMDELKHGRVIQVDPMTGAQTVFQLSFPMFTQANVHTKDLQKSKAEEDEIETTKDDKTDEKIGVPDDGSKKPQDISPEESA